MSPSGRRVFIENTRFPFGRDDLEVPPFLVCLALLDAILDIHGVPRDDLLLRRMSLAQFLSCSGDGALDSAWRGPDPEQDERLLELFSKDFVTLDDVHAVIPNAKLIPYTGDETKYALRREDPAHCQEPDIAAETYIDAWPMTESVITYLMGEFCTACGTDPATDPVLVTARKVAAARIRETRNNVEVVDVLERTLAAVQDLLYPDDVVSAEIQEKGEELAGQTGRADADAGKGDERSETLVAEMVKLLSSQYSDDEKLEDAARAAWRRKRAPFFLVGLAVSEALCDAGVMEWSELEIAYGGQVHSGDPTNGGRDCVTRMLEKEYAIYTNIFSSYRALVEVLGFWIRKGIRSGELHSEDGSRPLGPRLLRTGTMRKIQAHKVPDGSLLGLARARTDAVNAAESLLITLLKGSTGISCANRQLSSVTNTYPVRRRGQVKWLLDAAIADEVPLLLVRAREDGVITTREAVLTDLTRRIFNVPNGGEFDTLGYHIATLRLNIL